MHKHFHLQKLQKFRRSPSLSELGWLRPILGTLLVLLSCSCSRAAQTPPSTPSPNDNNWTKVAPGGATTCAHGDRYVFWYHPGEKDRLLIFFQGGGLCWNAETCARGSSYYLDQVSEQTSPLYQGGIFDLNKRENPFKNYSMLYIPYCTGDVHWGNQTKVYKNPGGADLVIQHKGFVNASTAMSYAFDRLSSLESVFVTGCSAGSVGAFLQTPYIIQRYPKASVVYLGDSLVFDYPQPPNFEETYLAQENFPDWIPSLKEIPKEHFRMLDFYTAVANYYPDYRFAQFSYLKDEVQDFFYKFFGGKSEGFATSLQVDMTEIYADSPNFRYYIAQGSQHCSMPLQSFYSIKNSNVRYRDWVAGLANGLNVPNIEP